jgi:hypothetical protein
VWPIEISQFLARNIKHHPGSELGALEVEFGPPLIGRVGFGGMQNLILPNFKKVTQSEFVCKSYDRFTKARPGYGSARQNMTLNQNQGRQKLAVCDSKGYPMD